MFYQRILIQILKKYQKVHKNYQFLYYFIWIHFKRNIHKILYNYFCFFYNSLNDFEKNYFLYILNIFQIQISHFLHLFFIFFFSFIFNILYLNQIIRFMYFLLCFIVLLDILIQYFQQKLFHNHLILENLLAIIQIRFKFKKIMLLTYHYIIGNSLLHQIIIKNFIEFNIQYLNFKNLYQ
ncbi:hypothetical protein IMG5_180650 [Ichthyophthirius multifiliis]|uniref:Transmembrane protein n=1 Tax=Ichthyophthirius multifiliis TaxID=5932 RepID=G0R2R2_ICHMU|nr:hypothetical protein IMG5_180650 [Ichthyophthirius multifiliis]EGR28244.1 hypothetical protein IMG5_180650 [Ichthyophthirius multifiliis]|eukprot:XP_004027589.1 hypothetical protein IMG5_180650 [Ichthyophthirius multifiliis]